jgi:hypothetical protein
LSTLRKMRLFTSALTASGDSNRFSKDLRVVSCFKFRNRMSTAFAILRSISA